MTLVQLFAIAAFASVFHALALCIAARLMVEIPVKYGQAFTIVAIEYLAMAAVAGALAGLQLHNLTVAIVGCSLAYLFVGAACLGTWIHFQGGDRLGIGNGVLIQAIQIPLIIPVLIVGSFLFDLYVRVSG